MTEDKLIKAHEVYQQFDSLIVAVGTALLGPLEDEQREYILDKIRDEFRFSRIRWELQE